MPQVSTAALGGQVIVWVAVVVGLASPIAAAFVRRGEDRRRLPDPMAEEQHDFRLSVPSWVDRWTKHGPWVLLSFGLIYYVLFVPKPVTHDDVTAMRDQVETNTALIVAIRTKMEEATRVMHDAVVRRNQHEEAVVQLLTQLCLLQADGPIGRQNCWTAMRGEPPVK